MGLSLEHLPADVLGLSETSRRALAGRPWPWGEQGLCVPHNTASLEPPADRMNSEERRSLAQSLGDSLSPFEPHVAVLDGLRALERPGACFVLAGQQPGLFGGPLYNTYKVLHTVRLARELSQAWNRPVVPGFWNHADDHDIAEVHHLWVQNQNLDLRKVTLPGVSSGRTPFSGLVFEEQTHRLSTLEELLRQTLASCEHLEEAIELFAPRAGESLSRNFTRSLLALYGHLGLVVIEPDAIRAPLSRSLARLVAGPIRSSLEQGAQLVHGRASTHGEAALLFRLVNGQRQALRLNADEDFSYDKEPGSRTGTELAAEIVDAPSDFSAGALLRPLVQDDALPVAAYVGGWGELAYQAELPFLRRASGVANTPFVPRLSATLLDPAGRASLDKLGLSAREVMTSEGQLDAQDEAEGSEVGNKLRELGQRSARSLEELREELASLDPGLGGQVRRAASQMQAITDKLAGKADRVRANQAGAGKRHARRVEVLLRPRDQPQERVRATFEVVARHGRAWIDELYAELDPFPTEHWVATLDPSETTS